MHAQPEGDTHFPPIDTYNATFEAKELAHAVAAGGPESSVALGWLRDRVPGPAFRGVRRLAELVPGRATSSVGRLFDAVAALAAVRDRCGFEGQAAMELEALSSPVGEARYAFELDTASDPWQFDAAPVIRAIVRDIAAGAPAPLVASAFHEGLAAVIAETGARLARQTGIRRVALTGGVFQNVRLAARAAALLSARGVEVLQHRRVPCNDGGLALGQAVAAARLVRAGLLRERHACA